MAKGHKDLTAVRVKEAWFFVAISLDISAHGVILFAWGDVLGYLISLQPVGDTGFQTNLGSITALHDLRGSRRINKQ